MIMNDFVIKRNVLKKYTGTEKHIEIPDFVTAIAEGAFLNCISVESVVIPESVKKICNSAFFGCLNLSKVKLPDTLKKIENFVFGATKIHELNHKLIQIKDGFQIKNGVLLSFTDSSIKNVVIPFYIHKIENFAFSYIDTFSSVVIPNTVSEIGSRAFFWCQGVKSVKLDSSFGTELGDCIFECCNNLSDVEIIGGKNNKYTGTFRNCKIQNLDFNLSNYFIKDDFAICNNVIYFYANSQKKEIHIPEGVTKIEKAAFCNCVDVEKIFIPDSVEKIEALAFLNCPKLKKIVSKKFSLDEILLIENKTKLIGITDYYAKSVIIPNYIKSFADYVIFEKNLEEVIFEDENNEIEIFEENVKEASENVRKKLLDIYELQKSRRKKINEIKFSGINSLLLTHFKEKFNLKNILALKEKDGFFDVLIQSEKRLIMIELSNDFLSWKNSLQNFLEDVCDDEKSVEEIEQSIVKNGVKITDYSFNGNVSFESSSVEIFAKKVEKTIEILNNSTRIIFSSFVEIIDKPFSYSRFKKKISELVFREGLKVIENFSFSNCQNLKNISIPSSVEVVGKCAFEDCYNLEYIEIKNPDAVIKNFCFSNCKITDFEHKYLHIENGLAINREEKILLYCSDFSMKTCFIPENLKVIGNYAFDSSSIQTVEIPSTIERIGKNVFAYCDLKEINIPDSVIEIGDEVFASCENLRKAKLSNNITYISKSLFCWCEKLSEITIPEKVEIIKDSAFLGCKKLKNVKFPKNLKKICRNAFWECKKLVQIELPSGVKNIEPDAFLKQLTSHFIYSLPEAIQV